MKTACGLKASLAGNIVHVPLSVALHFAFGSFYLWVYNHASMAVSALRNFISWKAAGSRWLTAWVHLL